MKTKNKVLFFSAMVLFSWSCGSRTNADGTKMTEFHDEATYGACSVSADESYSLIMDAEKDAFEATYPDAHLKIVYKPEGELVKDLMRPGDSTRFIVISRDLNEEEKKFFDAKNSHPTVLKVAYDAVAIINNKANTNDSLSIEQLRQILAQKITTWKQVDPKAKEEAINVVFDNKQSGNARFIKEKLLNNSDKFPSNCYAVNTNQDVINYVSEHPNAMGVIGVNWISDKDDSTSKAIMKKIKVVAISSDSLPKAYYKPYQAYIYQKTYPLCREVYIINREGRMGLGTGFAIYIASDKGQRIVLKDGLVPATMPVRLVNINRE